MLEIERTFLVKKIPSNLGQYKQSKIKQGYFSRQPSPLRIRKKDNKYEITKKIPFREMDFQSAEEINIPLKEEEFNLLWPSVISSLEKTRYYIQLNNLTAELDIFEGELEGLIFVEVEFSSEAAANNFVPPNWFGQDITQEHFSSNAFLAGKIFEEINKIIKQKYG